MLFRNCDVRFAKPHGEFTRAARSLGVSKPRPLQAECLLHLSRDYGDQSEARRKGAATAGPRLAGEPPLGAYPRKLHKPPLPRRRCRALHAAKLRLRRPLHLSARYFDIPRHTQARHVLKARKARHQILESSMQMHEKYEEWLRPPMATTTLSNCTHQLFAGAICAQSADFLVKIRPNMGARCQPKSARCWPNPAGTRPNSIKFGRIWTKSGQALAELA